MTDAIYNMPATMPFVRDDGGRSAAGYRGDAGDCTTRAIAIATKTPYATVYAALRERAGRTPRDGVDPKVYRAYLADQGWTWVPTMHIGSGCRVHLAPGELPAGRLIVRLSRHVCAVVDDVIHDTYDPSRDGTRCVYGLWFQDDDPGRGTPVDVFRGDIVRIRRAS